MPERDDTVLQSLLAKIHAMDDMDKEIMLLLVTAYAAGKSQRHPSSGVRDCV